MSNETTNSEKSPTAPDDDHEQKASRPSNLLAPLALAVSFWIIGFLGGGTLYEGWKSQGRTLAVGRCAAFIVLIAGVHWLGYRLWQRQFGQGGDEGADVPRRRISSAYWPLMKSALLQQNIVIILASLVLDLGQAISLTTIAVAAYWLAVGFIVFRRPSSPTAGDRFFVRRGFLVILVGVVAVSPIFGKVLDRW